MNEMRSGEASSWTTGSVARIGHLLPIGGATREASLRLLPPATVQLMVCLVVDDVPLVAHKVIDS